MGERALVTREQLLHDLASAALHGNLGLFVGSGITKALSVDSARAPGWLELLRTVSEERGTQFPDRIEGVSLPEVASRLVESEKEKGLDHSTAVREVKMAAARVIARIEFDDAIVATYANALQRIRPGWVVTTNYDLALERLLPNSECILPEQPIRARANSVPICHIHGTCLQPESMVLTSEDYVGLVASPNYRQARLATLFAESTTLMIGYALGDTNVQTARRLADFYRQTSRESFAGDQGRVIVAVHSASQDRLVQTQHDDTVAIYVREVIDLLGEIGELRAALVSGADAYRSGLQIALENNTFSERFIRDREFRKNVVLALSYMPSLLENERLVQTLRTTLEALEVASRTWGAFEKYTIWLEPILDLLEQWPISTIPPRVLDVVLASFARLANSIHPNGEKLSGFGWDAGDVWKARREKVLGTPGVRALLTDYARRERAGPLAALIDATPRP